MSTTPKSKRFKLSAAARQRMSEGQKRRYANLREKHHEELEQKMKSEPLPDPGPAQIDQQVEEQINSFADIPVVQQSVQKRADADLRDLIRHMRLRDVLSIVLEHYELTEINYSGTSGKITAHQETETETIR